MIRLINLHAKINDFLNNEANLDAKINMISSQYALGLQNSDFIILFTSLGCSLASDIKNLNNRFNLLEVDLKGFVLLD